MAIRKARGLEVIKAPFQELYEGSRPSIHGLKPASFLPIVREDKRHEDDPVVLEPGTVVGLKAGALVPASSEAFNLAYTALDVTWGLSDEGGNTVAAGDTDSLTAVKPIGVVTAPVYSAVLADEYTNYKRDLTPSILSGNYSILVPCTNAAEHLIEAGDRVIAKAGRFASLSQEISGLDTSAAPLTGAELDLLAGDHIVGRCINKIKVADTTETSAGVTASAAAGLAVAESRFSTLSRVQTVPGLGLTGSDTQGLPQMVWQHGVTEVTSGDIAVLEIRIDL